MKNSKRKIISLGGSIVIPKTGFDSLFLKKFTSMIVRLTKEGMRFVLIVGGGTTARIYQEGAKKSANLSDTDLDQIGIYATRLNAQFVRFLFGKNAYKDVIIDPTKKVNTTKPIIIGAGWKPGFSTDNVAVHHAKVYGAKSVFNLSNISFAYDKDPNKYKDAKKITSMDWKTFRKKVVGNVWKAGKSAPFDPIASRSAQNLGLTVSIVKGTDLKLVEKALRGENYPGTIIHP